MQLLGLLLTSDWVGREEERVSIDMRMPLFVYVEESLWRTSGIVNRLR